jgi:hypothetical protein
MEFAPAGVPLSFEVTFDRSDLDVGMSIYDDSGSSPVLLSGPTLMVNVGGTFTYRGKFTATNGKSYVIIKAVYTNDTLETLDQDYSQGSESIVAENLSSGGASGCDVVGYVEPKKEKRAFRTIRPNLRRPPMSDLQTSQMRGNALFLY